MENKVFLHDGWTVTGAWPYAPVLGRSLETGGELMGVTHAIPARVPGCVQDDLHRAGLLPDPYVRDNSLRYEWVENRWWIYEKTFAAPDWFGRVWLCFDGLDYIARVYLNNRELCRHEGTFLPLKLDVTDLLQEENVLRVVFEECPQEMGLGLTSKVHTQKPRFCYHWDFSTRMIPVGIWDSVYLHLTGESRIDTLHIMTDLEGEEGILRADLTATAPAVCRFTLVDPQGRTVAAALRPEGTRFRVKFRVPKPRLWWPLGYGGQPLYTVKAELLCGEELSDEDSWRTGIRSLRYVHNPGAPEEALPYTVVINGRRIFLKGVNTVPFDQLFPTVTRETYSHYVTLLREGNINLVRIWGGGLIEKEIFYRLCDEAGILIWQEFIQSSSGVENVPPETPKFLALLEKTSVSALVRRRNHVCLTVWCGGNELRIRPGEDTPVTLENKNVALLKQLVETCDPQRIFYPASACGPYEFIGEGEGAWDAHGRWRYDGTHSHYPLYDGADCLLHSEFGADGMSDAEQVRYVLDEAQPAIRSTREDLVWRMHGEWWDNLEQNTQLFGEFTCLEDFVLASQLMQAEAVRYIVEADIRRAPKCSGCFVWQFNEPWPNISCTNLVQHSGKPKLAYYAVKNAYMPVAASLKYTTVTPDAGEALPYSLWVTGDCAPGTYTLTCETLDSRGAALRAARICSVQVQDGPVCAEGFSMAAPSTADGLFFLKLTLKKGGETVHENTYFFSTRRQQPFAAMLPLLRRHCGKA